MVTAAVDVVKVTFCGRVSGNVSPELTVDGPRTVIVVASAGDPIALSAWVTVMNAQPEVVPSPVPDASLPCLGSTK
jgi:hypothetical protein